MFGFSFGELVVLMIVAVVVIGPKDLPKVLRRAGQWASKLRRMASDIRTQSGIDDVLRGEGIAEDIAEIRKLARGEMADVTRAARVDVLGPLRNEIVRSEPQRPAQTDAYAAPPPDEILIHRDREYPREGADAEARSPTPPSSMRAAFPASPLARDPLYVTGDPDGVIPRGDEPQPEPAADAAPLEESAPEQPQHDA